MYHPDETSHLISAIDAAIITSRQTLQAIRDAKAAIFGTSETDNTPANTETARATPPDAPTAPRAYRLTLINNRLSAHQPDETEELDDL
jgi:hypothetical protein